MTWKNKILTFLFVTMFFKTSLWALQLSQREYEHRKNDVNVLRNIIEQIESSFSMAPSFYKYKKGYLSYIGDFKGSPASRGELKEQLGSSNLVLFGDEHTNKISQTNVIWIMRQMTKERNHNLVLVIEWVDKKYQIYLDQYFNGELSESQLRQAIQFDETWGFSWPDHYRILEVARELGVKTMAPENKSTNGGDTPVPLATRDNNVVKSISKKLSQSPESRFLIMYGHFHLAGGNPGHLKEKLKRANLEPDTIVYPESNGEYWNHLRESFNTKDSEVLRFSSTEFYLHQGDVERKVATLKHYTTISNITDSFTEIFSFLSSKKAAQINLDPKLNDCEKSLMGI